MHFTPNILCNNFILCFRIKNIGGIFLAEAEKKKKYYYYGKKEKKAKEVKKRKVKKKA